MLMKEKNYDFRKRMLEVHERDIRNTSLKALANEFEIKNGFTIVLQEDSDDVVLTAAKDFVDYLFTSMGVSAMLRYGNKEEASNGLVILTPNSIDLGEAAGYRGYRIDTNENTITICGYDSRGVAQALYYLEDVMTFRKAPYIPFGTVKRKPMYGPQMVHSGYGLDEYPNEHLSQIAHEGRDAILVFVKDVNITPYGYLDFNELIYRASKYGIDVYAYSKLKSEMHPDEPGAEAHYEASYGRLFKECPKLKGVTLVGESVEFPSKDPNVTGRHYYDNKVDGIPTGKTSPGWYPCCDYYKWLNLVKKIVRKYNPDADIVFWSYNWGYHPEELRVKLIESLPRDISLLATFEMFENRELEGMPERCSDYTLSFVGPGKYFESEAIAAKRCGIRLYSMTNTGGLTWDFGVIPYEPFPYQWIKRYEEMEKAHNKWGLCGLMESHHFGFYPSFISKLSKWAFYESHEDLETILLRIIKSEYGEENADAVNNALKLWSEAITYGTPSEDDQYGPFRVGPSYPLCLRMSINLPSAPYSMFGSRICNPMTNAGNSKGRDLVSTVRIPRERDALVKMKNCMTEGFNILKNIANPNDKLLRLINMGEFIIRTITTAIHVKTWHLLKMKLFYESDLNVLSQTIDELEKVLLEEKENTLKTIPLVEVDSRLGWEPSMEYMTDPKQLDWKLRHIEYVLNFELANERKSIKIEFK